MQLELPPLLQGIFFNFVWDKAKVWALPTPSSEMATSSLEWHLELSVWSTVIGQPLFNLAPKTVMNHPQNFAAHWARITQAELVYPLELFQNNGRWVILDGYHRLARHILQGHALVPVRLHSITALTEIQR